MPVGLSRAYASMSFLHEVFFSDKSKIPQLLQDGAQHIAYASAVGDVMFFEKLAEVISTKYIPSEYPSSLLDLCNLPVKTQIPTSRQWARRLWISRCFWLTPKEQLVSTPFEINTQTLKKLSRERKRSNKTKGNDDLFVSSSPWFELGRLHSGEECLGVTKFGEKALGTNSELVPWEVQCADFL